MRKIVVAVMIVLGVRPAGAWWDNLGNPDKYTSFALDVSNTSMNADGVSLEHLQNALTLKQESHDIVHRGEVFAWTIAPSMRFPISPKLTLDLRWAHTRQTYEFVGAFTGFQGTLSGETYGIGLRYYFDE